MSQSIPMLSDAEFAAPDSREHGLGALTTTRGNLPLRAVEVEARISGLFARTTLRQTFVNTFEEPLEATYIFPLPDRAAVTGFRMQIAERVIEGQLKERGAAREAYAEALEKGHRAAMAEEDRPGVFTMQVGNLMPGEAATVTLDLVGPLVCSGGEATYRFPLVVAPRYIPGAPIPDDQVGLGTGLDTEAVPDASRITPPVLLPGFPNPVRLSLAVEVDPAGLPFGPLRSSLHAVATEERDGVRRVTIQPGERLNRDFILRIGLAPAAMATSLVLCPDQEGGTFALALVPPAVPAGAMRARDVVFLLDRSGSMGGWKMVAARRAIAAMVETLTERDRFAILAFDDRIERPKELPATGLAKASDGNRFQAAAWLGGVEARGGTEMAEPLDKGVTLLAGHEGDRDQVLVLVTDGQVGNEDQLLASIGKRLGHIRVFTVGIDMAVNAGFLNRLASVGRGACELVESEDRLETAMAAIHRTIGVPVLTDLRFVPDGLKVEAETVVPGRMPDVFTEVPLVVMGRYTGSSEGRLQLRGRLADGTPWEAGVPGVCSANEALTKSWARGRVRELEDRYAVGSRDQEALAQAITATSLRYGVLCRFTAYVAVDTAEAVNVGGQLHQVVQAVEAPAGWAMPAMPMSAPMPKRSVRSAPILDAELFDGDGVCYDMAPPPPPAAMVPTGPMPAPVPPDPDRHRKLAEDLLHRLQAMQGSDAAEMAACLDACLGDLGRLWTMLVDDNVAPAEHEPLELLLEQLETAGEDEMVDLWQQIVDVVERILALLTPQPPAKQRRAFWR